MSLLEWLIKPLPKAQYQKGYEEGRQKRRKEAEAWKKRQEAAGVKFTEDPLTEA